MAKAKTTAKATPQAEETKVIRPNDLAKELDVDAKRIRAYLRTEFARESDSKNTNWELTPAMADKVRERFTASNEDSEES